MIASDNFVSVIALYSVWFFLAALRLSMFVQAKLNCPVKMLMSKICPLKHEQSDPSRDLFGSCCFSREKRCQEPKIRVSGVEVPLVPQSRSPCETSHRRLIYLLATSGHRLFEGFGETFFCDFFFLGNAAALSAKGQKGW